MHAGTHAYQYEYYANQTTINATTTFEGTYYLLADGTPERPIVIKAAGDGEVIIDGRDNFNLFNVKAADYTYFEGITFRNTKIAIWAGTQSIAGSKGLTVKNCRFEDVGMGVFTNSSASADFYIADSVFLGRNDPKHLTGWTGDFWRQFENVDGQQFPPVMESYTAIRLYGHTSGSTGKPKGVVISHHNIRQYINWAIEYFNINSEENILNTSPLHFDMSAFDIYCALQTGASLTLVPEQILIFPIRLIGIIEKRKITIWKAASSIFSYLAKLNALNPHQMISLRKIIFSGEPLPTKYLIEWMKIYPGKEFYNAYGPSECTGISTCYRVEILPKDPSDPVPIGKACSNKEMFALSEGGTLAKVNEVGELYIRGSSLSSGYWNDPENKYGFFMKPSK